MILCRPRCSLAVSGTLSVASASYSQNFISYGLTNQGVIPGIQKTFPKTHINFNILMLQKKLV